MFNLEKILKENEVVVIDLETTGLDEKTSDIIEVGAVKILNGKISNTFSSFVFLDKLIPQEIVEITGIQNDWLECEPELKDVLAELRKFCGNALIAGHNANFDYKFLKHHGEKFNIEFSEPSIDTANFFTYKHQNRTHREKLAKLTKFFDIEHFSHRALNDALATAELIVKLANAKVINPFKLGTIWWINKDRVCDVDNIQFAYTYGQNYDISDEKEWERVKPKKCDKTFNYYPKMHLYQDNKKQKIIIEADESISKKNIKWTLVVLGMQALDCEIVKIKNLNSNKKDSLYNQVLELIKNGKDVKISTIQKTFSIGYIRASKIIDNLIFDGEIEEIKQTVYNIKPTPNDKEKLYKEIFNCDKKENKDD